jgi:hypothetical protein
MRDSYNQREMLMRDSCNQKEMLMKDLCKQGRVWGGGGVLWMGKKRPQSLI